MNRLLTKIFRLVYFCYSIFPIFLILNFFRYWGRQISLFAFVFTPRIGKGSAIGGGVYIDSLSQIGNYSYIAGNNFHLNTTRIENTLIGNYCSIGLNCHTLPFSHNYNNPTTFPLENLTNNYSYSSTITQKIVIQNDVWIGSNVIILGDVTIGNGVVIGAGSVVTHSVPDYAIVAGNPAKIIKYRFSQSKINKLSQSAWWNFPPDIASIKMDKV